MKQSILATLSACLLSACIVATCIVALTSCSGEQKGKVSAGTEAGNRVFVIHPHEQVPEEAEGCTTVFLAGTIDMGNSIDWQAEAVRLLEQSGGRYLVFNPRQKEWHPEREGEMDYQVNWELEHLEKADIILMNFLPDSKSPITLLELGLFAGGGKLRVICPEQFYRYDNVRITCGRYGVPMFDSISSALETL